MNFRLDSGSCQRAPSVVIHNLGTIQTCRAELLSPEQTQANKCHPGAGKREEFFFCQNLLHPASAHRNTPTTQHQLLPTGAIQKTRATTKKRSMTGLGLNVAPGSPAGSCRTGGLSQPRCMNKLERVAAPQDSPLHLTLVRNPKMRSARTPPFYAAKVTRQKRSGSFYRKASPAVHQHLKANLLSGSALST